MSCNTCHKFPSKNWKEVRKGDEAFPDITEYPEHQGCISCHRQQFFARERPSPRICLNCHENATPRETSRFPFPSLGERFIASSKGKNFVSDFRVFFPHDKHLDAISRNPFFERANSEAFIPATFRTAPSQENDPKSCAVCHQTYQPQGKSDDEFVTKPPKDLDDRFWLKKGTFKTRPATHASCSTCHNQETELAPLPQNCDACHKLSVAKSHAADFDGLLARTIGIDEWWTLAAWSNRFSAGTFRHEVHTDLSCTKCHDVKEINTVDVMTLKVPVKSCGGADGCHITATTDDGGILNYEMDHRKTNAKFLCAKCHLVFGNQPAPASHLEAIPKTTK
jgi:hypothetical protein